VGQRKVGGIAIAWDALVRALGARKLSGAMSAAGLCCADTLFIERI
jgi:hypothetical protein